MIYSMTCTDRNPKLDWQCELLEYSWSRVNQPGELIRLVACEPDESLPSHRHTQVIRTRPSNIHPSSSDNYPPYNRLFSFQQWLSDYDPQGTVLILDPDMVFSKPLDIEPPRGTPVGQDWLDFGVNSQLIESIQELSDVNIDELQAVTWPAFINSEDLRRLMPRWIELTAGIRDLLGYWESDMFAFVVAAAELDLRFLLEKNTAWAPWPSQKVGETSMIHYCQKIYDENNEEIWWKQSYKPWARVNGQNRSKESYCDQLLELVDEYAEIKQCDKSVQSEDTIFVAIASYCEPELASTIESCLCKARRPENLRFGICLQYDDSDKVTDSRCLDQYSQDKRFRYLKYPFTESQGGCWARNLTQQLYEGERYTLQIDAHSQLRESWDTILIKMLSELPSDKPLITAFPPLYHFEDGKAVYKHIDHLGQVNTAVATVWNEDGSLQHTHQINSATYPTPTRTRLVSGAFVFTLGRWNKEVTQDPEHFYTGEEFALTIRSFTWGYDMFSPSDITIWHRHHPAPSRKFWNDNSPEKVQLFHDTALQRLRWLYKGDTGEKLGDYGLGTQRTLAEFYIYSGLDCESYFIHPDAVAGIPPNPITIKDHKNGPNTPEGMDTATVDIRIFIRGMTPLEFVCTGDNPILELLFRSLFDKQSDPSSVIYLNTGENGEHVIRFKKSNLLAIETEPPLPEQRLEELLKSGPKPNNFSGEGGSDVIFSDEWKYWIWNNISHLGLSRDSIFKELILKGFSWEAARQELNFEPTVPLADICSISEPARLTQDKLLIPGVQSLSNSFEIYSVQEFLSDVECELLCSYIDARKQPSLTASPDATRKGRTSQTCFFALHDNECALANDVTIRVAKLLGINHSYAEPLQGHIYSEAEEYKVHPDFFSPGTEQFEQFASDEVGGQRTWSALIYLNDVDKGGATVFPNANLVVRPRRGKIVFWNNLLPSGQPNVLTLHAAKPLTGKKKIVLSQWFRSIGKGEFNQRDRGEYIPAYTKSGFEKTVAPTRIVSDLKSTLDSAEEQLIRKESGNYLRGSLGTSPAELIDIPEALKAQIFEHLRPICEQWSGQPLAPSAIYGIRRYTRGSSLGMHRDTSKTHIISAIINVAQKVDEAWPLEIEDHGYRSHKITLNPGEMLLYEGARLSHGRPMPLNGEYFCNLFIHFRPVDYVVPEAAL